MNCCDYDCTQGRDCPARQASKENDMSKYKPLDDAILAHIINCGRSGPGATLKPMMKDPAVVAQARQLLRPGMPGFVIVCERLQHLRKKGAIKFVAQDARLTGQQPDGTPTRGWRLVNPTIKRKTTCSS